VFTQLTKILRLSAIQQWSLPQRLLVAALFAYPAIFAVNVAYGRPGLGLGQIFYLPIVLVALSSGPIAGAGAGLFAFALYVLALVLTSHLDLDGTTETQLTIRLAMFAIAGAIIGYFSARGRSMLRDSLRVLEELLLIARRDVATGVSTSDRFTDVVERHLARRRRVVVLVGELDTAARPLSLLKDERELREALALIAAQLEPDDELARVGASRVAIAAVGQDARWGREMAALLEERLRASGREATFGWATSPGEGKEALALVQAASERLLARRFLRGEWQPSAESAGLSATIEDLGQRRA
jgi:GGDEF domain-containing protein